MLQGMKITFQKIKNKIMKKIELNFALIQQKANQKNKNFKIFFLVLVFLTTVVKAQNFTGLQGKELNRIDDASFALLSLGAKKLNGKIETVTVTYDSEKTLKLKITHTGLETTYVSFNIVDSQRKKISNISGIKYFQISDQNPLIVEFLLKSIVPEGTEIESAYLQIDIKKAKKNFLPTSILYSLTKEWKTEINAENLIIPIKLEPIGSAGELRSSNRVFVIPYKRPAIKRYTSTDVRDYRSSTNSTRNNAVVRDHRSSTNTARNNAVVSDHRNKTSYKPLLHYWSNSRKDNLITATAKGKSNALAANYRYVRRDGYVLSSPSSVEGQTIPLWLYYHNTRKDNFITASATGKKVAQAGGYRKIRIEGYVLKTVKPQYKHLYKPLWLYYNSTRKDNFTTATAEGMKAAKDGGYRKVRIEGYVRRTTTSPNTTVRGNEVVPIVRGGDSNKTKEAQGPDNKNQISLWDNLATDIDFEFPYEITNIRMDVYPDKNLNSGVFYYLPSAYHLQWNMNEGYQFKMLYGTAKTDETSGDVRMAGVLTPSISKNESALIKSLVQSYVNNNKSIYTNKNIDLKIMPIKSIPTISLSSGLQSQYEISEDKINVTISSTINNPIDVSWTVDNRVKEEIQVALSEGVGIQGTMVVVPDSETIPEQLIPVRITLSDTRTIGKLKLQPNNWRTKNWVNQTPFPLKLKYIHALVNDKVNGRYIPMVYSWDLNNTEVPSKSKVEFNSSSMPKWIDSKTERIWIDYTIDDCNSCVNKIMDKLTGGTSGGKTKTINFKSFKIFEETKASSIEIYVRSLQADPKGKNVIKLTPIIIENDLSAISAGPFYLQESSELKYEYKLKLITSDGVEYIMDDWQSSNEENVNLGMHTLKKTISNFPEF